MAIGFVRNSLLGGVLVTSTALARSPTGEPGPRHEPPADHLLVEEGFVAAVPATAVFREEREHVSIVEFEGDYARLVDGEANLAARAAVAQAFLETHDDAYDFLVVFTQFPFDTAGASAFHLVVRNEVSGIGLDLFDQSSLFGSEGVLRGYTDMARLADYEADPLAPGFERTLTALLHELFHQWGARVDFRDGEGDSGALRGIDGSHWSFLLDSDASVHYGATWRDNLDGTFTAVAVERFLSPLDLYLAGFTSAEEVPPLTLLDAPGVDPNQPPQAGAVVSATPRTVTVEEIVAAEGSRDPPHDEAPQQFQAAFLYLVRPGSPVPDSDVAALENVRRELLTRFVAATGGRGILEIHSNAAAGGGGAPEGGGGGEPRGGPASVVDALAWLRAQQRPEGFWEDLPATRARDTGLAAGVLAELDPLFDPAAREAARSWLAQAVDANTDALARSIRALRQLDGDAAGRQNALLTARSADGGWGLGPGLASDPLDTALGLGALVATDDPPPDLAEAADLLLERQSADGGWSPTPGGASRVRSTAAALQALRAAGQVAGAAPAAVTWLAGRQNPDGGFGDSPSTPHETAEVLEVLMDLDALGALGGRAADAIAYLESTQTVEGSWGGSVFATALVAHALQRWSYPNWRFAAELSIEPPSPVDGERATVAASIANDGNLTAPPGLLRLFDGAPEDGGLLVAELALPPLEPGGVAASLEAGWDTTGRAGNRLLVAVIDPDAATTESSELDNRAELEVEVVAAPVEAELALFAEELVIDPPAPDTLPTQLAVSVPLHNLGQSPAADVQVRLAMGSSEPLEVASLTVSVPGRSSIPLHFLVELIEAGTTTLAVEADPDDLFAEPDEANNVVSRTLQTTPSYDLEVLPSDLSVLESPVYLGLDATFEVRARNRGTSDAPDVPVALSVSDGTTIRSLPPLTIQLDAGEETLRTIVWRVDLVGDLTFTVALDPGNLVPELDEVNNMAGLPFTSVVLDAANLTVSHQDLGFAPEPAREGEPLEISALVRNTGGVPVTGVVVQFADGDPAQGGPPLGDPVVIPELAAGAAEVAALLWPEVPDAADRLIFVRVDPADAIAESDEEDNVAFRALEVASLPDAALSAGSLTLEPALPAPGQTVTLRASVANLGEQEIVDLRVRAWEGDPTAGGVQVGGDQSLALLPGGASGEVAFTWNLVGDPGADLVVVTADPDAELREGDETNNTAARAFGVQDEDFFVTSPYFSPDGDGRLDETTLYFELDEAADVRVEVVDVARGGVVRTFAGPDLEGTTSGAVTWDGRNELGVLARDTEYALRVVDTEGEVLGEARATLDTDRSALLLAAGTSYAQTTNLSCDLGYPDDVQAPADEEWAYFYVHSTTHPVVPKGVFRRRLVGGELETLVSASWLGTRKVEQLVVDPTGSKMAINLASSPEQIWVANTDGTGLVALPMSFNPFVPGGGIGEGDILGFAPGGQGVVLASTNGFVAEYPLSGSTPQRWWPHYGFIAAHAASPDSARLALRDTWEETLVLIDLDAGTSREILDGLPSFSSAHFTWSPDGRELAVASYPHGAMFFYDRDGTLVRTLPLPTLEDGWRFSRPHWRSDARELVVTGEHGECTSLELLDALEASGRSLALEGTCSPWPPPGEGSASPPGDSGEEEAAPPLPDGPQHDGGEGLRHPVGHLTWDPNDRALLWFEWNDGFPLTAIFLDESERQLPFLEDWSATFPRFTASGRSLFFDSEHDGSEPANGCWGTTDRYALRSLMNLTVDLEVTRPPGGAAFLLEGTAIDLNFARWQLDYAPAATPTQWSPIAPPAETTVVDGYLATWVPPGPGTYQVRLTAEDLAGNSASRVRTIVSNDSPEITDVTVTPRLVSPNGDGILDELTIQYRVLESVNLEIHFFDSAGRLVRTFELSHSTVGEVVTLTWDGRDETGRIVPDGASRVLVHLYEFFFEIDATPPRVDEPDMALSMASPCADRPCELRLAVDSTAEDPNLAATTLERGEGQTPATWLPMGDPDVLALEQFVGFSFRTTAEDEAGNRTVHHSDLAPEGASVTGIGPHEVDPATGHPLPVGYEPANSTPGSPCAGEELPCFVVPFAPLRLALGEAVRTQLAAVALEYRVRNSGGWLAVPILEFFDPVTQAFGASIPPSRLEFVWDPGLLDASERYDLRVRSRDAAGSEFVSQELELAFSAQVLVFAGRLDWHTAQAVPALLSLLEEAGLDPVADLVLWGSESIEAPLAELTLFFASEEDPRYDPPRTFAPAAQTDGFFLFQVDEWRSCTDYTGHLVALTEPLPGVPAQTFLTPPALVHLPCLELTFDVSPALAGDCGEALPQTERTIALSPRSLDGSPLLLLSLFGPNEQGEEELLYTVNQPASGGTYAFRLDLGPLPEGVFTLAASLSNVNGEEVPGVPLSPETGVTESDQLVVDRVGPRLALTYPVAGQRLCADPMAGGVLVEGSLEDDWGAAYALELGVGTDPDSWQSVGDPEADGTLGERLQVDLAGLLGPPGGVYDGDSQRPSTTSYAGPLHRLAEGLEDDLTARAHAADASGAHVCEEVTFFLDAQVVLPQATLDRAAFSPNGDGLLEVVTLTVQAGETTAVDVEIFPGVMTELGPSVTGPKLRTLASDLPVVASASLPWDGRDDQGALAPDASYLLFVTWSDGCGNLAQEVRAVELDTAPPSVAIVSPTAETELPMIVQIVGVAADRHFDFWSLQAGEGSDPESWIELESSHDPEEEPFAYWNTYGLAGTYTLRLVASDTVGLVAEARVVVDLDDRTYIVSYLEADPDLFSPNGDGRRETTAIRFGLQFEARVTLTVRDAQGNEVERLVDDEVLDPGAWIESWDGGSLADDRYTVRLDAALLADPNVTQSEEVRVDLDRTAPTVALERPTPGGWLRSDDSVFGTISDERLAAWSLAIADEPAAPVWQELAAGDTNRIDYAFAPLTGFAEGDYALKAFAADRAEIETELVLPFGLDDTAPAAVLTAPPPGTHLGAILGPVEILGGVADDHLAGWRLEVGTGPEPAAWTLLFESDQAPVGPALFSWDVGDLEDGEVTLRLAASDRAGNEGVATLPLRIDNTPPVATILSPAPGAYVSAPGPVTGTASDANLLEYRLAIAPAGTEDFSEIGLGTASVVDGTLATWSLLPADGLYDLRLAVRDQVGYETEILVPVTVDTRAPSPPTGLTVTLVEGDDASLAWNANPEPDVAGYHVFRNGARLTTTPVPEPAYVDSDLDEGVYQFTVTAVDLAGQESAPSAPALLRLDRTPPLASIFVPSPGQRVAGVVEVRGTAWSSDDFAEYRLSALDQATGTTTLLERSNVPVQAGPLGAWSTLGLPEGAAYGLRLEAEDSSGNLASHEVSVTVDNLPPAPPTGLTATVTGSNVHLTWNANSEPDFAAYLLFRDGEPRGGELIVRVYDDLAVPDGTHVYLLHAIDQAGNVSGPSNPKSVTIDTRPPHAVIVEPASGTTFDGPLYVLATCPDEDVAQVSFQYRPAGGGAWLDAAPPVPTPPWDLTFDPEAFQPPLPEGDYDLQAVATDAGGDVDPAPTPITVTYADVTAPAAPANLLARVAAGAVTLTWSPVSDPDLEGYLVYRADGTGPETRLTSVPIQATSYVDSDLVDALYGYRVTAADSHGNESGSAAAQAYVYTPALDQPLTPRLETATDLEGRGEPSATVTGELTNAAGTSALPAVATDNTGEFRFAEVPLALGDTQFRVRITDDAGNVSKDAAVGVVVGTTPGPPTGLTAVADGSAVELAWNPNPEPDVVGYRPFRDDDPLLAAAPIAPLAATASISPEDAPLAVDGSSSTAWWPDLASGSQWIEVGWTGARIVTRLELDWYADTLLYPAEDFDVETWSGVAWVPLLEIRDNQAPNNVLTLPQPYRTDRLRAVLHSAPSDEPGLAELRVLEEPLAPLPAHSDAVGDGVYRYQVTAVNAYAFESDPSVGVEVEVGDLEPPSPVVLAATALGFDVELSWTPSASPDVVRYDLYRDGAKFGEHFDLDALRALDRALPSGTYAYSVRAVDAAGNQSPDSNVVPVTISMPAAFPLVVASVPQGRALDLDWEAVSEPPAERYAIWRGAASGGPYTRLLETAETTHRDAPLVDGTAYFYVVVALDAAGEALANSNEASGTPRDTVPPPPPDLHHPTAPGVALAVRDGATTLVATAEPEAAVEFLRDGAAVGSAQAAAVTGLAAGDQPDHGLRRLSPDGAILWGLSFTEEGGDLWVLHDTVTGQQEFVLEDADGARWTADSQRLVFASDDGAIRAYDVERRTVEELTMADDVDLVAPSPSLDRLAVFGDHDGQRAVWLVDLEGGQWTQVASVQPFNEPLEWSPTGRHVVYGYAGRLYLVDVATGVPLLLAGSRGMGAPSWSPDGSALLYPVVSGSLNQVWRYRLDSGASEQITVDPAGASRPQWSPDGHRFAYLSGTREVRAADWNTGTTELLLETATPCSPCVLQWVAGGRLWIETSQAEWLVWSPAGLAISSQTALQPGVNTFTAVARDAAGNASPVSPPISVEWASAGAPDLAIATADLGVLPGAPSPGGNASASITVRNLGPTASSPSDLLAYVQGPGGYLVTLFTAAPVPPLLPGGEASFSGSFVAGTVPGAYQLVATADPFDRVEEGDEGNNLASRSFPVVPGGGLYLSAATDRPLYQPDDLVLGAVEIAYGGEPLVGRLEIRIEDPSGYLVATLLDGEIALQYGDLRQWPASWSSAGVFAGPYALAARLFDEAGQELAEATASFVVEEGFELAAAVGTDRPSYEIGEPVRSTGEIRYLEGNALLGDLEGRLQIIDPLGQVGAEWSVAVGPLLPGGEASFAFEWPSAGQPPGAYRATWNVLRDGLPLATAETSFALAAPPGEFSGELELESSQPPFGPPLSVGLEVANASPETVAGAAVRVRLVDPANGAVLHQHEWLADFDPGEVFAAQATFETDPLEETEYLVVLAVEPPAGDGAGQEATLAIESFVPVDRTAPSVIVLQPLAGGFLGSTSPASLVHADDERSGIQLVEARVDEGAWVAMIPADGEATTYRLDLSTLEETDHRLEARGTDNAGNTTATEAISFTADWTPPLIQVSGVADGGVYEAPVTPVVEIVEIHPYEEEIRLDGEPFVSGTPVEEPGSHLLEVGAEDAAGNPAELALSFIIVPPGQSLDLVVNTVNDLDDGTCDLAHCSLREAIVAANAHPSFDTIRFAIPGLGSERVISPHSALPAVVQPVWFDGASQAGSTCTGPEPRPAVVLDGSSAGIADGLALATSGVTLRGLTVRRFDLHGLRVTGGGNHSITCLRLGDDGAEDASSGNGGDGVHLDGGTSGNAIGADADSGVCEAPCNVIGFNGGAGIAMTGSAGAGNAVRRNRIRRNEALGLDLSADGLTANDPGDPDAGPNDLQNFPQVAAVRPGPSSEIDVVLQGAAEATAIIDLFAVAAGNAGPDGEADPPPFGEGDEYLGSAVVTTDAAGFGTVTLQVGEDLSTTAVTATATALPAGNTSEFSPVFAAHLTHAIVTGVRAEVDAAGEGIVEWTTVSEAGTLGFDLYREVVDGGEPIWHRVTERLIGAFVETPAGATYRVGAGWLRAGLTERFVLVEVEASGARRVLGPYPVTVTTGSDATTDLPAGRATRRTDVHVRERWVTWERGKFMEGDAPDSSTLKLGLRETGGYRLSAEAIAAALLTDESTVRLRIRSGELRLTYRGADVPWLGAVDGSDLVFYALAPEDPYSPESVLWLTLEGGTTMAARDGGAPPARPGGSFTARRPFEENAFAATVVALDPDEDFWFWRGLAAGDPTYGRTVFPFDLVALDPHGRDAQVTVELYGASAVGIEDEHVVEVLLGGLSLGTTSWTGFGWHEATFEVPAGLLAEAGNQLELLAQQVPGVPYSFAYVNRFEVAYPRLFEAAESRLLLTSEDLPIVTVDGFAEPEIVALDVTDPGHPLQLINLTLDQGAAQRVSFVPEPGTRDYWLASASALPAPDWLVADAPSDLRSPDHAADLLVISTPEFLEALAPLLDHRRGQGWRVLAVDIEDVYDEFNDGLASPHAIEALVRLAAGSWASPPRWVLLAGAGTYDYRDAAGLGGSFVPPLLVRTPSGLFAADGLYGDMGGGDGIPEVAVGRIPAKTAAEVAAYAVKVIAYESQPAAPWLDSTLLLADDRDGAADFGLDTLALIDDLPAEGTATPLLLDDLDLLELRAALFDGLAQGAGLVHYLGHGGFDRLAAEPILAGADVPALANAPRLPVVLAPTCVAARHEIPGFRALGELLVVEDGGGAVAVLSSSGLSQHGAAAQLSRQLVGEAWGRFGAESLGEALLAAYRSHLAAGGSVEALRTLTLLGDPALRPPG